MLLLNAAASSSAIAHESRHIESSPVKGMAKSEGPCASARRLKRFRRCASGNNALLKMPRTTYVAEVAERSARAA